ncbi:MAG: cytochrome P460 family protein [Bryobacteraceae bacterium]
MKNTFVKRLGPPFLACGLLLGQTGAPIDYTADGSMNLPKDYRQWVFLSSGINMTYGENAGNAANPRFENVFVNPSAHAEFLKTGNWPDKTALILEIRGSDSKVSINKDGRVQTNVVAVEAHVKDKSRGGWAFYGFQGGVTTGKLFPKTANCYECHEKSGAVDSTFVQFYPTLIDPAKKQGTYHASE